MEEARQKEPVNLLSLDGGGVRGVSSLVILHAIMTEIKKARNLDVLPKPCEYFHMIAGTSTGGLIAIMLGRLRMSTKEALDAYDEFAARIFCKKNRKKYRLSDRYFATPLKEIVQEIVKERGVGELMWDPERPDKGKAMVCVMPLQNVGHARVIRTFPGDEGVDDQWDRNIMIWEAARATTAAPTFFKPQVVGGEAYVDGALGANNPVDYLLREAVQEFGSWRRLGCIVSIGTGTREIGLSDGPLEQRTAFMFPKKAVRLAKVMKAKLTDPEAEHERVLARLRGASGAYFRFNVPKAAETIALDNYLQIPELKSMTSDYLRGVDVTSQVQAVVKALNEGSRHGFTLGLTREIDTEQVILSDAPIRSLEPSTPFFVGRKGILDSLDRLFSPRNNGGVPRRECLIHGMAGTGKTSIALKASELFHALPSTTTESAPGPSQHRSRFQHVFFIDGSNLSTVCRSYARICKQQRLGGGTVETMKELAMDWIAELTEEWLLIFDDFNFSDRQGYVPAGGRGNIIYTSRSIQLRLKLPSDRVFEVLPFEQQDAIELLLRASDTPQDTADMESAVAIVEELGYLPLNIDNAAAAIRDGPFSLKEYLETLRKSKVGILSEPGFENEPVEHLAVYAALDISRQTLEARRKREGRSGIGLGARAALKILKLLSFFHHKEFPAATILARAAKERAKRHADIVIPLSEFFKPPDREFDAMLQLTKDGQWNQHYFGVGLTVLRNLSLVTFDARREYVSMHALVHSWARHRLTSEEHLQYNLVARIVITEAMCLSEKWIDAYFTRSLAPHIETSYAYPASPIQHDNYKAQLLLKLGWFYQLNKKAAEAEAAFLECLHIWKLEFGNHDWNTIIALQRLGALYHETGRLGDAELVYLEVVERIRERMRDHDFFTVEGQDAEGSGSSQQEAMANPSTKDPTPNPEPFTSTQHISALGHRRRSHVRNLIDKQPKQPQGSDAPVSWTHSGVPVELDKTSPVGTKPPRRPDDRNELAIRHDIAHADLARVYMDQGRFGMGKRMLIQVLRYLEEDHDIDPLHPEFLRIEHEVKALTDPGNWEFWNKRFHDMNDIADAEGENSDFWETGGGFALMVAHANCLLKNGLGEQASQQYCIALELFQRIYGPGDKRVLEILRRMVDCKVEGDEGDEAVAISRDCVRRARRTYGDRHRETALALEKEYEALFFRALEDTDEGQEILRQAVDAAEGSLGPMHPIAERIRNRLARVIRRTDTHSAWVASATVAAEKSEADTIESAWEQSRAHLEHLRASVGPNHILTRRFARLVGDRPPKSREEYLDRMQACFGSHNSMVKKLKEELGAERATERCREPGSFDQTVLDKGAVASTMLQLTAGTLREEKSESQPQSATHKAPQVSEVRTQTSTALLAHANLGLSESRLSSWGHELKNVPVYTCGLY
ncbi:hypothetical protein VTJ83DRAFT_2256 [Remersonia thermophila]|uniref:PNPLA domain-containing protein n=1 Tax=Remersonia thermophila TaxID=72144 RepID=A0ABR4DIG9_9PEZI